METKDSKTRMGELTKKLKAIQELDWVSNAWIEEDSAPEGFLSIQIEIAESEVSEICGELGYE